MPLFCVSTCTTCFPSLLLLSFEAVIFSSASWKHKMEIGKNATSEGDKEMQSRISASPK